MLKVWIEFSLESSLLGEMDKRSDEHDRALHVLSLRQEVDSLGSSGDLTPDVDPATGKPRDPNKNRDDEWKKVLRISLSFQQMIFQELCGLRQDLQEAESKRRKISNEEADIQSYSKKIENEDEETSSEHE